MPAGPLEAAANEWRRKLRHVYWIGGGSGAGKSTVARRLAARHGLRVYSTDDVMPDHARRVTAEESPYLREFSAMDLDERWVDRSPSAMLDTFHWFQGEGFRLIVDDLLDLPKRPGVVVEGFRLLPHLVQPLLAADDQAVWLLPTPEFRTAVFEERGTSWFPYRTRDPGRALANLYERDRMFTERLRKQAKHLGLHVVEVGTDSDEDDLVDRVARLFGLRAGIRPGTGPGTRPGTTDSSGR